MKIMHIRAGMYFELGFECILGWDKIRESGPMWTVQKGESGRSHGLSKGGRS